MQYYLHAYVRTHIHICFEMTMKNIFNIIIMIINNSKRYSIRKLVNWPSMINKDIKNWEHELFYVGDMDKVNEIGT